MRSIHRSALRSAIATLFMVGASPVGAQTPDEPATRARRIVYWSATGVAASVALLGGFSYVTSAPEAIENFRHVGYPQQLRVLLGIAKLAGAIVLLLPRLRTLKEWAYGGFTFTWIAATVAHYLAGDGALSLLPVALLAFLAASYVTRPPSRRGLAEPTMTQGEGSMPLSASGRTASVGA